VGVQRVKHFKKKEKVFGQFFTPQEVADFIVSFACLHIDERKRACDPACGDGVFLRSMLKSGFEEVIGVDLDKAVLEKMPRDIKEDSRVKIFVGNGLIRQPTLFEQPVLKENYFDLVAGNPPFSAKYGRVTDKNILNSYELGKNVKSQAIEVLFLERFVNLARKGGVIAIILPDGIFLNLTYRKVREFIFFSFFKLVLEE